MTGVKAGTGEKQDEGYETCPDHGDTLMHAEDVPGWEPRPWPWDDQYEHLVCGESGCEYEVWA
jgi:hypothetical protein